MRVRACSKKPQAWPAWGGIDPLTLAVCAQRPAQPYKARTEAESKMWVGFFSPSQGLNLLQYFLLCLNFVLQHFFLGSLSQKISLQKELSLSPEEAVRI